MMSASELIAILSGVTGLVVGLIAALSSARKSEMESLRITLDSVVKENDRLRTRMKELEKCVEDGEDAQREAQITILRLSNQLEEWKEKYSRLDVEWKTKYSRLQSEFDDFKRQVGNSQSFS